jgi:hypothetical protein
MDNIVFNDINLKDFKLNEEGSFSITRPYESAQVVYLIKNFIELYEGHGVNLGSQRITDATACMGGDVVRFSKYFAAVNGVEILEDNYNLLVQNCRYFGCNNVKLVHQNYLDVMDQLEQDIVYIDPKWGGVDYKHKEYIVLKLDDMEISELVETIKNKKITKYIFVKAPLNVCLEKMGYDAIYIIYNKSKAPSFKLLCFRGH